MSIDTPGVYTITFTQPDSKPDVSLPNRSASSASAQVLAPLLVVCTNTAVLRAAPLAAELAVNQTFVGQWEVVSRKVRDDDPNGLFTSGADFAGIRFESGVKPVTRVTGLPFGILTVRWAIYRQFFHNEHEPTQVTSKQLVDEALVTILVLTENLASDRLITLQTLRRSCRRPRPSAGGLSKIWSHSGRGRARGGTERSVSPNRGSAIGPFLNDTSEQILRVEHLRVGVTRLIYDMKISDRAAFLALMRNRKCPQTPPPRVFHVERVHAYLSLRAIGFDHECDAYVQRSNDTNGGSLMFCLESGDDASQKFFAERVTLIEAPLMEEVIKTEAAKLAREGRCSGAVVGDIRLQLDPCRD